MTTTSVLSFPERGNYGRSSYRGNCSGHVVKTMLDYYDPKVFVDPSEGSGTSRDVCAELNREGRNIEYIGLDLHSGFNLLKDNLAERIGGQRCDYAFFHPSYFDMILYSGGQWGDQPHPDDLSRCKTYGEFLTKLQLSLTNIYEAVRAGGNYSVLIGDYKRAGEYISIQSDLLQLAPGKLENVMIKLQHNVRSNSRVYPGKLIPIMHEYLLNFRKDRVIFGMLDTTLACSRKLEMLSRANWSATIANALNKLGGRGSLSEIYEVIQSTVPDKLVNRPNWQPRVRNELGRHFVNLERGVWALPGTKPAPRQAALFA